MTIKAYAAKSAGGKLEEFEYEPGPLGVDEVDVAVTHCGICSTDVGIVDNIWGISTYPCVVGHETVGIIEAFGDNVDSGRLKLGQRVGIGAIGGACMQCAFCLDGRHQLCAEKDRTAIRGFRGGFASHVRASHWQYAFPIPDNIASEHAGPLLCAGATVFTPLLRYQVRAVDSVAVVGIGGLGHLALQFMSKWGCEVTAISTSRSKEKDALEFGANDFISTTDSDELRKAARSFDFILCTVSADLPWKDYLAALRPQGKLCIVGLPENAIAIDAMDLLISEKLVVGSIPGSPAEITKMLGFASRHEIKPTVELFSMSQADKALEHTRQGKARFRTVLERT